MAEESKTLRVGQFSAYYGDRADTFAELIDSGVQVLTGDYLAELTMLVLKKNQLRGGDGYATGFVGQLKTYLRAIADRQIKVVTNAGGLEPLECAAAVRAACAEVGVDLKVAAITGDNVIDAIPQIAAEGEKFLNLDTGAALELDEVNLLTANAYLGAWPIVAALNQGADIVICPRVTDASLVIGPAAWYFGWAPDDYDQLAGALWAGHAIECGGQVTGGNFSLFTEYGDLGLPGMPIADIHANGDVVITKAGNTGGVVDTNTLTAQLLYEVGGAAYHNPDVTADLSSLRLRQVGPDQVAIESAAGFAPTSKVKLSLGYEGGYRNTLTVGITGANVEAKAAWLQREVAKAVGEPESFDMFRTSIIGPASAHEGTFEQATAWVVFTARDRDRARVGRAGFADPITQLGVSNIPGFYLSTGPQKERLVGVQWPCVIERRHTDPAVVFADGDAVPVPWPAVDERRTHFVAAESSRGVPAPGEPGPTTRVPFGSVFGTRSGDKAGMANVGIWARTPEQYAWLADFMTIDRIREMYPELGELRIERHVLSNLLALNFQLFGYLELGVASCTRLDAQAKGVGEFLGSRYIELPTRLLPLG